MIVCGWVTPRVAIAGTSGAYWLLDRHVMRRSALSSEKIAPATSADVPLDHGQFANVWNH
jgi:hypothetical protein